MTRYQIKQDLFVQFLHYLYFSHFLKTNGVLLKRKHGRRWCLAEVPHSLSLLPVVSYQQLGMATANKQLL